MSSGNHLVELHEQHEESIERGEQRDRWLAKLAPRIARRPGCRIEPARWGRSDPFGDAILALTAGEAHLYDWLADREYEAHEEVTEAVWAVHNADIIAAFMVPSGYAIESGGTET